MKSASTLLESSYAVLHSIGNYPADSSILDIFCASITAAAKRLVNGLVLFSGWCYCLAVVGDPSHKSWPEWHFWGLETRETRDLGSYNQLPTHDAPLISLLFECPFWLIYIHDLILILLLFCLLVEEVAIRFHPRLHTNVLSRIICVLSRPTRYPLSLPWCTTGPLEPMGLFGEFFCRQEGLSSVVFNGQQASCTLDFRPDVNSGFLGEIPVRNPALHPNPLPFWHFPTLEST